MPCRKEDLKLISATDLQPYLSFGTPKPCTFKTGTLHSKREAVSLLYGNEYDKSE
jgi:hypothetical protein